jgi:hypothetical protein
MMHMVMDNIKDNTTAAPCMHHLSLQPSPRKQISAMPASAAYEQPALHG